MTNEPDEPTLAAAEVEMAEYLVERAKAGAEAQRQILDAESAGQSRWSFPSTDESALELLEVWAAVKQFPPDKWWRKPRHPG
jgi:uncharacterized membrane protein YqiK